jgi:stalled ribosome rescue protein Dom34
MELKLQKLRVAGKIVSISRPKSLRTTLREIREESSMAHIILWIESDHAHIFNISAHGIEKTILKRNEFKHHTFNKKDHHGDPATLHFFKEIAERVGRADELLIVGPGLAKTHFERFLKSDRPNVFNLVVGTVHSDHITDNQIHALGRKFFKTWNLFNHSIRSGGEG